MKIGDLAARAACDVQTIRYYEKEGLLDKPSREASGYRRYEDAHLARLHFIRHCRSLDIPLAEVRRLIAFSRDPGASCGEVNAVLDEHIATVRRRIAELTALERQLTALRGQCEGSANGEPCAILASFMNAPAAQACACHG